MRLRRRELATIVFLGAALRLFPVWFGLPSIMARPDEETAIGHAMQVLAGDLNPHFFHWPSLIFYLFAVLLGTASWLRRLMFLDPEMSVPAQFVIGRVAVALAGTLTIVVLFRLVRRLADETTALLAALFLAVAFLHVRESHFAMTDVVMTLLLVASLAMLLKAFDIAAEAPPVRARAIRHFTAAGVLGGLAASTKYSAAAVVAAMGVAQLLLVFRWHAAGLKPQAWKPSVVFCLALAAAFVATTPYAVIDYTKFVTDFTFDLTHLSGGHALRAGGWAYHLQRSLPYGLGLPLFAAAIPGIVVAIWRYRERALVLLAFAGAFYFSVGSGQTVFFRYVLPLIPIACILAAIAVREAASRLAALAPVSPRAALAVLTVLVAAPALVNDVRFDVILARTDTRVLVGRWLTPLLEPDQTLHESGSDYTRMYLADRNRVHHWYFDTETNSFDAEGHLPYWLVVAESPLFTYINVPPAIKEMAREKYVLVAVFPATTEDTPRDRTDSAIYDLDDAFFVPASGFGTMIRPGPTLFVYRRADAGEPVGQVYTP